jgi:hypothetical protein
LWHLAHRLGVPAALLWAAVCVAQTSQPNLADYRVYTKHPRLWLDGGRLDRLRHEVERDTDRWRQLQTLSRSGQQFPEEPLWLALQFQVAGSQEAGRKAADWALGKAKSGSMFSNPTDLRLGAIVFDWCHELLSQPQREGLAVALGKAAQAIAAAHGLESGPLRSAVLAAVAVADDWEPASRTLLDLIDGRWRREILPALVKGETPDRAAELMAMLEIFHAVRYNLEQDLWREADGVFRPLPRIEMLRYYPRPVETDSGFLRERARPSAVKLDAQAESVPARIAEMMLVAYENTLEEYQFLQGWIRHDAYVLRDAYGAVYEFIWINPYLPGLSYSNSPPVAHDEIRGRVFGRQGWNDDDVWAGYLDGELQVYGEGQLMVIGPETRQVPLEFAGAAIVPARLPMKFEVQVPRAVGARDDRVIYVVGLREGETYNVKVNGSRFRTYTAGRGGIIPIRNEAGREIPEIDFDQKVKVEVRGKK